MIVGTLLALILYAIYFAVRKALIRPPSTREKSPYGRKEGSVLAGFILLYLVLIVLFSPLLSTLPH